MEALQKADDGSFLRSLAETVLQIPMEAEVEDVIGAGRYERSGERSTWRNGYRDRSLDTRLGQLNPRIPKLRTGSYFPPFLEVRKTTEKALVSVIQEAWIAGVSTQKVDDLVQAMGLSGSARARSPSCARRSTSAWEPFSSASLRAIGHISRWTRPTSRSARAAGSSQSPP